MPASIEVGAMWVGHGMCCGPFLARLLLLAAIMSIQFASPNRRHPKS